ncbi:MAG: guanylate kinase [Gemmataceae bacterium]
MTTPGPLIIISAPSGTGKTTIVRRLLTVEDLCLRLAVSATTRAKRNYEVDGKDYHFLTKAQFEQRIAEDGFLEWAEVHDNYYGTPKVEVEKLSEEGYTALLDIDVQGARQVREKCPEVKSIFLKTPSREELERRLRSRKTESEEEIQIRLKNAEEEERYAHEYTKQIVNDDLETAMLEMVQTVRSFLEGQSNA